METLAITGATGFLGRHLVTECASRGRFRLRLLTRHPELAADVAPRSAALCQGDLLDAESLKRFLEPGCTVVHLAYLPEAADANLAAARNLASAARQAGVKRVVHCSTAVVVGFTAAGTVTEDTVPAPAGEYQRTKYEIEQILRAELSPGIELAILRPTEIIGPGGQGLRRMIERLRAGGTYTNALLGCVLGRRRFNYVSVHNVVEALLLLATTPVSQHGEIYNLSDDDDADNHYAAVESIVASALNGAPVRGRHFVLPAGLLSMLFRLRPAASPPDRVYSSAKIQALGYSRVRTLRAAISELVAALRG